MPGSLTLNDIRDRAREFSAKWKGEKREEAEKQTFWNELFEVFGVTRRRYAVYEVPVSLREGKRGKVDVFWPGTLLAEHKSAGHDLTAAFEQARDYFHGIAEKDLPKLVVVSDFARFRVYFTNGGKPVEFPLSKLRENISAFNVLTGHTTPHYDEAPDVNVKAAKVMAKLHESLLTNGYSGHPLAVLMVRLMFCFFADKTGIFDRDLFRQIIELKTAEDGRDVGPLLINVFEQLNKPKEDRQRNLDPDLKELEYVNGHLFEELLPTPAFDRKARSLLLDCLGFDWSAVSPAVFGAMFQGVMDEEHGKRRKIGAHYTSEKNILKAIGPLLIDPLRAEYAKASGETALQRLLNKIGDVKVLDPACGCGNFLVIAYRELRQVEIDTFVKLQAARKRSTERLLAATFAQRLDVDAMYGIEIEDFPCRVAETALYIMDHMMNNVAESQIGPNFRRLPLSKAPHITKGNALRLDWKTVVPADRLTAIVGNPPFLGKKMRGKKGDARSMEQAEDMAIVFGNWDGHAELDYVAGWYAKALAYAKGTTVPVVFVSTNSLTQGEQVSILWPRLVQQGVHIHFAHRTFRWTNEAPGKAAVHCVIIGWSLSEPRQCLLFDYETPKSDPLVREVKRINPYLVEYDDVFVFSRRKPLCDVPPIRFGNMANDDGNLLLSDAERKILVAAEPRVRRLIRRFYGSDEFINGIDRWCLWLADVPPADLRGLPEVMRRINAVRAYRQRSPRATTRALANKASLFGEIRQHDGNVIVVPRHSSELRRFVPMAFVNDGSIIGDACTFIATDNLFVFGILQSTMHMAWVRNVGGRIKSDFRYTVAMRSCTTIIRGRSRPPTGRGRPFVPQPKPCWMPAPNTKIRRSRTFMTPM